MNLAACRTDRLALSEWNGETVVALGPVDVDPKIPRSHVLSIPKLQFVNPAKLCARLPEAFWERKVLFVLPAEADKEEAQATLLVQKHVLARVYLAFFHRRPMPEMDQTLTSLLGALKDPTRSLSQLRNYPWLLRYPLADKLRGLGADKPALILLAGPSLQEILPRLPELAERCLVICIARTLRPCLEAGVEPDFVIQYDTNMEQRQFYEGVPRLENTVLVSLSSAHVHPVAELFRGLFLRASFGQAFLPNSFVLRDGVEGSLIACLGLVEALGSSNVYVSGADLSWPGTGERYVGQGDNQAEEAGDRDVRAYTQDGMSVELGRRDNRLVHSSIGFVAAGLKAGEAATEISAATGASFYTLSEATLLPEKEFPLAALDEVLAHPPLDRAGLLAGLDRALAVREPIDLKSLWTFLRDNEHGLRAYIDLFTLKQVDPASRKTIMDDPMVRVLSNMRGACWHRLNDPLRSAERLLVAWRDAYADARKFTLAHLLTAKKAPLLLLCAQDEEQQLRALLERLIPGCVLAVRRSAILGHRGDQDDIFDDRHLPHLLADADLVLVSPKAMQRHAHFWELAPDDKVIDLRALGPAVGSRDARK